MILDTILIVISCYKIVNCICALHFFPHICYNHLSYPKNKVAFVFDWVFWVYKKHCGYMFNFVKEVRNELKKVSWPTRPDTIRLTLIVIAISVAAGLYLGGLDLVFTQMLKLLVS